MSIKAEAFMSTAPAPTNGNTPWAARYAAEVKRIVVGHAERAPRSLQLHLGPSELGVKCDRQVVGKMAGLPKTNHVSDPWPSVVGTAVHAWLAECFSAENFRSGVLRFVSEQKVAPVDAHPGTADLYDAVEQSVDDHKCLGETSMAKVRSPQGPPRKYQAQLFLYGLGYIRMGLPVKRVALIAYPRTSSTLDGLYVWEHPFDYEAMTLLQQVLEDTERRKVMATEVHAGRMSIKDIPMAPDDDECYFCPLYRPQAARDGGAGCPGTIGSR